MRTDADDLARVRDPTVELLLSHTATLTDEWCSRPRPVEGGWRASARSDQRRSVPSDRTGARRIVRQRCRPPNQLQPASHGPHVREAHTAVLQGVEYVTEATLGGRATPAKLRSPPRPIRRSAPAVALQKIASLGVRLADRHRSLDATTVVQKGTMLEVDPPEQRGGKPGYALTFPPWKRSGLLAIGRRTPTSHPAEARCDRATPGRRHRSW
jgi:hypothetical protein